MISYLLWYPWTKYSAQPKYLLNKYISVIYKQLVMRVIGIEE